MDSRGVRGIRESYKSVSWKLRSIASGRAEWWLHHCRFSWYVGSNIEPRLRILSMNKPCCYTFLDMLLMTDELTESPITLEHCKATHLNHGSHCDCGVGLGPRFGGQRWKKDLELRIPGQRTRWMPYWRGPAFCYALRTSQPRPDDVFSRVLLIGFNGFSETIIHEIEDTVSAY